MSEVCVGMGKLESAKMLVLSNNDLLYLILSHLDLKDLLRCRQVSKAMYHVATYCIIQYDHICKKLSPVEIYTIDKISERIALQQSMCELPPIYGHILTDRKMYELSCGPMWSRENITDMIVEDVVIDSKQVLYQQNYHEFLLLGSQKLYEHYPSDDEIDTVQRLIEQEERANHYDEYSEYSEYSKYSEYSEYSDSEKV